MRNAGPCTITAVDAWASVLAASIAHRRLGLTEAAGSASAVTPRLNAAATGTTVPVPSGGLWDSGHPHPACNSVLRPLDRCSNASVEDVTRSYMRLVLGSETRPAAHLWPRARRSRWMKPCLS